MASAQFSPLAEWDPLSELAAGVSQGKIKATDLVEKSLETIERAEKYNALITVCSAEARQRAAAIDDMVEMGQNPGRLAGVPFIAKDNYLTQGIETTAGSNILKNYRPPYSATAIKRLEDEGAVLVAKANLDAFAHGSSTEHSDFGPTLNPYDTTRVPGGSSGGSAAAVALGLAPLALGSDTGGSIRLPASFCGVVGYKPTYGLVSRYGVVAMASSTDVMGPMTKTVADSALALDILAGADERDSTMIVRQKNYAVKPSNLSKRKIGLIKEFSSAGLASGVKQRLDTAVSQLREHGAVVEEISLPLVDKALAMYYIIVPAEVSSNLSRYDGIRYGQADLAAATLDERYINTRTSGFNEENKRRIMIGGHVLSSGYYDAYYKKAQTVRTLLIKQFAEAFKKYDVLLSPTAATTAFKLGANDADPLQMYLMDTMTVAANLVGNPAISIPAGLDEQGLPIGLQLMTAQGQDAELLGLAQTAEELWA